MCIRDRLAALVNNTGVNDLQSRLESITAARLDRILATNVCLLYTSDAADDLLCVDLGGRRIIKKKSTLIDMRR